MDTRRILSPTGRLLIVVVTAMATTGCQRLLGYDYDKMPTGPTALTTTGPVDPVYTVTMTADATTLPSGGSTIVHAHVSGAPDGTRVVFSVANGSMMIEPTEPGSLDTVSGNARARYRASGANGSVKVGAARGPVPRAE